MSSLYIIHSVVCVAVVNALMVCLIASNVDQTWTSSQNVSLFTRTSAMEHVTNNPTQSAVRGLNSRTNHVQDYKNDVNDNQSASIRGHVSSVGFYGTETGALLQDDKSSDSSLSSNSFNDNGRRSTSTSSIIEGTPLSSTVEQYPHSVDDNVHLPSEIINSSSHFKHLQNSGTMEDTRHFGQISIEDNQVLDRPKHAHETRHDHPRPGNDYY